MLDRGRTRFEVRDGWNVAGAYTGEAARLRTVGFADASHLRTDEVQGKLPDGLDRGVPRTSRGFLA
jgi:hypothetical protein